MFLKKFNYLNILTILNIFNNERIRISVSSLKVNKYTKFSISLTIQVAIPGAQFHNSLAI